MSWLKFLLWLSGLYTAYYLAMVAWDILRGRRATDGNPTNELSFSEQVEAVTLTPELSIADIVSPLYASGGVTLKDMYNLCRDEAVEYIKQVSF